MEQRGLLVLGTSGGDPLERVPQHGIAAHPLVHREVALEHAAIGAERRHGRFDVRTPGRCHLAGGWGQRPTLAVRAEAAVLPLEGQVFLLWMELLLRRRAASGATAGTVAATGAIS